MNTSNNRSNRYLYITTALLYLIVIPAAAQLEINDHTTINRETIKAGTICQFINPPSMEEVLANCMKYEPKSGTEKSDWNAASFSFSATAESYSLQMIINSEACASVNIDQFNWIIQEPGKNEIFASGNLFNRKVTGLTRGNSYSVTYNWRAVCQQNSIYPYLVCLKSSPVELLSLSAEQEKEIIKLKWSTASEIENDYFDIERSSDNKTFTKISTIKGRGDQNSIVNYTVNDEQPVSCQAYYRLKQVDLSGTITYSQKIGINYVSREDQVKIMPNAVKDEMYIKYYAEEKDLIILRISDTNGNIVLSKPITASFEGLNIYNFTANDIKPGTYTACLMRSDKTIMTRFTKE